MVKGPLADRLEYAILEMVFWNRSEARHQDHWGDWHTAVRKLVPEFTDADLKSAFKRLWKGGVLRLTKPDSQRYHAFEYSGDEAHDEAFFLIGPFNASITDEGRSYWDGIRVDKPRGTIGFRP